jgi:thiol-disulfide isomerase/thioredoxin
MIRKIAFFTLLLCVSAVAQATSLKAFSGNPTPPPLALKDLQGNTHTLEAYKGKVVLVQFWATYCGPCRKEMPTMNKMIKKLEKDGVPFKILAIDMGEGEAEVKKFVEQVKPEFTILLDETGKSINDWKVFAVPSNFIIDPQGKIRYTLFGGVDWADAQLLEKISALAK